MSPIPRQPPRHLFTDLLHVYRAADTVDEGGSPIRTFAIHLPSVRCNIQPQNPSERISAGRVASRWSARVFVKPELDIAADDEVLYGDRVCKIEGPLEDGAGMGVYETFVIVQESP